MSNEAVTMGEPLPQPATTSDYVNQGKRRDEALAPDGTVKPIWRKLFDEIENYDGDAITTWTGATSRISRERGLAYRPARIDDSADEGWTLGPIPWLISPEDWSGLEAGIAQRNLLFEALLKDVYGPRNCLKEGLFPAEILLGHRGFLRALHNLPITDATIGLGVSAHDIAKDSSGQTFVVNDRFDSPFGLGLALENRTVVNKVLPGLFSQCGVRRIGQFFTDWFDYLGSCSPSGSGAPQVVILDASEQGEDSEVSFLANYCGISRVHPSDLTVRDGRVWIKALTGLVPVDVIWKAMPGRDIDSLESENSYARGIAGLFESMRRGQVSVASHPGSELLQSPGFFPYLPEICKRLLGEDLLIPPVATWWCGGPNALSHVLANLSSMVVKPTGHHSDFSTQYGSRLSKQELSDLSDRIAADPTHYVGQEELAISTLPTARPQGLVARGAVLRTFAFSNQKGQAQVMPGGLARVSTADGSIISTRQSGESKDVWVCSDRPERQFSISSALSRTKLITPDIVPSRTGENLFWTGRYAERTDVISRFAARVVDVRMRGFTKDKGFGKRHEDLLLEALFGIFECESFLQEAEHPDAKLGLILEDRNCPVSVPYNLERFFNATQTAREEWSPASIRAVSSCYDGWMVDEGSANRIARYDSKLDELQLHLSAFLGLNLDSMTRDEGWALLDAGRRIERTSTICGLLRFLLKTDLEDDMNTLFNESILYLLDSVRTFQSRFHETPSTELTVRLLIGESDYPRSVLHLLIRLNKVLRKLPPPRHQMHPRELVDPWVNEIISFSSQLGEEGFQRSEAIQFIDDLLQFLTNLSDALTISYFSHASENV